MGLISTCFLAVVGFSPLVPRIYTPVLWNKVSNFLVGQRWACGQGWRCGSPTGPLSPRQYWVCVHQGWTRRADRESKHLRLPACRFQAQAGVFGPQLSNCKADSAFISGRLPRVCEKDLFLPAALPPSSRLRLVSKSSVSLSILHSLVAQLSKAIVPEFVLITHLLYQLCLMSECVSVSVCDKYCNHSILKHFFGPLFMTPSTS